MCLNPQIYAGVEVACHKCSECMRFRVDTIVGRCIAEQKTSQFTYTVTLTYGGDDRMTGQVPLNARILDFRDVSLYVKRLRNFVPVRYVAAGEYGTEKGRGHWHLVIFTNGHIPNLQLDCRYNHRGPNNAMLWNDGYSFWEEATYKRMRYACSYVLKEADKHEKTSERRWGASRHPPLGRDYFRLLACQHVDQGLSPQDCWYTFPDVCNKDGVPRRFLLTRASARYYKQDFIDQWMLRYHNFDWPQSDMIDEYVDTLAEKLSFEPGDWLEERRYYMAKKGEQWHENTVSVGMLAQRHTLAMHPAKLDDKLRLMGNRKGRGYSPEQ